MSHRFFSRFEMNVSIMIYIRKDVFPPMFTPQDLLRIASRDYILGNVSLEEQVSFIEDQIADPFGSGDVNYLKGLKKMVAGQDELDEYCLQFITKIQDIYPHLSIDVSEYDSHFYDFFSPVYKFFVKSIAKIMYIFIREYLANNKNRKVLVDDFMSAKLPNYPKEQYGKKEYYILVTKLPQIIDDIFDDDVDLKKFINYVKRADDGPVYLDSIQDSMDAGLIVDKGVCKDLWKIYKKTDQFRLDQTALEMEITSKLIIPYLEENNMLKIRIPPTEEVVLDDDAESDGDSDG